MPCDTIQSVSVDLGSIGKVNPILMALALRSLGESPIVQGDVISWNNYREFINTKTGQTGLLSSRDVNQLKRAYSHEVVKSQAKKFGWTLKQDATGKYQAIKR